MFEKTFKRNKRTKERSNEEIYIIKNEKNK